jgi:hypothetical protein
MLTSLMNITQKQLNVNIVVKFNQQNKWRVSNERMGWNNFSITIAYYCIHTLWLCWLILGDYALDDLYVGNRKRLSKKGMSGLCRRNTYRSN